MGDEGKSRMTTRFFNPTNWQIIRIFVWGMLDEEVNQEFAFYMY